MLPLSIFVKVGRGSNLRSSSFNFSVFLLKALKAPETASGRFLHAPHPPSLLSGPQASGSEMQDFTEWIRRRCSDIGDHG